MYTSLCFLSLKILLLLFTGNALISKKVPGREIKNNNLEQSQWCTLTSNNNIIDITHKNVCVQLNPNQSNQVSITQDSLT